MVAYSLAQRLTPKLALAIAAGIGLIAALAALLVPGGFFEDAVLTSGVAAFVPAAEPPLGMTARLGVMAFAGGGAALLSWGGLSLLAGLHYQPRLVHLFRRSPVRRADAHPDAPPREPLRAGRDLGFEQGDAVTAPPVEAKDDHLPPEPLIAMGAPIASATRKLALDIPADPPPPPPVQPLPADLDQPLAAFDPAALRDDPLPAPRAISPLAQLPPAPVYTPGERFETFDLAPPPPVAAPVAAPITPITAPETVATVHSLLDRLERGMSRRTQPPPQPAAEPEPQPQGLESTLDSLRRMAAQR